MSWVGCMFLLGCSLCNHTIPPPPSSLLSSSLLLSKTLVNMLNESKLAKTTEVVIAPSSVHLHKALSKVRPDIAVAAQDVWTQGGGAFTGETSAEMLKDLGAKWTLTGASRRGGKGGEGVGREGGGEGVGGKESRKIAWRITQCFLFKA